MMKEIRIIPSIAYNDEDFKETVEAFSAGMHLLQTSEESILILP
jgi:hypothetical protein